MSMVLKNIFQKTKKYNIPQEEIRAFLALRGIGCLGADILKGMDKLEEDDQLEERKRCFIQLINGTY